MNKEKKIILPDVIYELAKICTADIFVVGGKVRDFLLNIKNDDIDLCSSLEIKDLEKLFKGTKFKIENANTDFGTAKIVCEKYSFDYATLRLENYKEGGHRCPNKVVFTNDIKKDFLRRDFTVNSIYYNINTNEIFDYCNALFDIEKRLLRTVNSPIETFKDDGLRVLRMFRFACVHNFKIEKNTFNAALKNSNNIKNLSNLTIYNEFKKVVNLDKKVLIKYLKFLNRFKVWSKIGFNFDCLNINMVRKIEDNYLGLLIDIIDSEKPISIAYFLNGILTKFEINNKPKEEIVNIISGYYDALNKISNKTYFAKYFDSFKKINTILLHKSKGLANKYQFFYKYILSHKLTVKVDDLDVSKSEIKQCFPSLPEKSYDEILRQVLSEVFDGKYANEKNILLKQIERKIKFF